jgi:hypothetical protein
VVWVTTSAAPASAHAAASDWSLRPLTSLIMCAPAPSAARATGPRQVSTDTSAPRAASRPITGTTRSISVSTGTASVSVRPDSPPTSTIAAPSSTSLIPRSASSSGCFGP